MNAAVAMLPPLREDLELLPGPPDREGGPTWTIHDPPRHRFFQIGRPAFELLCRWETGDPGALLRQVHEETTLAPEPRDLEELLLFLRQHSLLRGDADGGWRRLMQAGGAATRSGAERLLQQHLFLRLPLLRPHRLLTRLLPHVLWLTRPGVRLTVILAGVLGLLLTARQGDVFLAHWQRNLSPSGAVGFAIALMLVKVVHELGHALTARYYGCRVASMGVALMVFWPVLYTDTSDAWRLTSRRQRLAISAAGVAAELALAVVATLAWNFLPDGSPRQVAFFLATTSWTLSLLVNLNPLMRFDGYYLLADALGVRNLQERAFALGRWQLRETLLGLGDPPPEPWSPSWRRGLILLAWSIWVYRFFLFLGIALVVYHFFFKLLGLVMLFVEVGWFLVRPVAREVGVWRKRGARQRFTVAQGGLLLLLALLTWLAVTPWHGRVTLPAVLRPAQQVYLFPPVPAQLAAVRVRDGERVDKGQHLFRLLSPELDHALAQSRRRLAILEQESLRQATGAGSLEGLPILERQLRTEATTLAGLTAQQQALMVTAPWAGTMELGRELHPGRWLDTSSPIALLVAPEAAELHAYATAEARQHLTVAAGWFHPEDPARAALPVVVTDIGQLDIKALDLPLLVADHGGAIPARRDDGLWLPLEPVYRVTLHPTVPLPAPNQTQRGVIHLPGRPWVPIVRLGEIVVSVIIRESGF